MANIFNIDPAQDAAAVTPNDTTEVDARALYIGTGGNVQIQTAKGTTVVFANVVAGTILDVRAKIVFSTNTTASDIVALY